MITLSILFVLATAVYFAVKMFFWEVKACFWFLSALGIGGLVLLLLVIF